jgi:hypothetical protein
MHGATPPHLIHLQWHKDNFTIYIQGVSDTLYCIYIINWQLRVQKDKTISIIWWLSVLCTYTSTYSCTHQEALLYTTVVLLLLSSLLLYAAWTKLFIQISSDLMFTVHPHRFQRPSEESGSSFLYTPSCILSMFRYDCHVNTLSFLSVSKLRPSH